MLEVCVMGRFMDGCKGNGKNAHRWTRLGGRCATVFRKQLLDCPWWDWRFNIAALKWVILRHTPHEEIYGFCAPLDYTVAFEISGVNIHKNSKRIIFVQFWIYLIKHHWKISSNMWIIEYSICHIRAVSFYGFFLKTIIFFIIQD